MDENVLTLEALTKAVGMLDISVEVFFDGISKALDSIGATCIVYQTKDEPHKLIVAAKANGRTGYHVIDLSKQLKGELAGFQSRVEKWREKGLPFADSLNPNQVE